MTSVLTSTVVVVSATVVPAAGSRCNGDIVEAVVVEGRGIEARVQERCGTACGKVSAEFAEESPFEDEAGLKELANGEMGQAADLDTNEGKSEKQELEEENVGAGTISSKCRGYVYFDVMARKNCWRKHKESS